jgi:hypothetical protein
MRLKKKHIEQIVQSLNEDIRVVDINVGTHLYVTLEYNGKTFKSTFPGTPSDKRWLANKKSELRRQLRAL